MRRVFFILAILSLVGCVQIDELRPTTVVKVAPNVEIRFIEYGASKGIDLPSGEVSARDAFLCIGLSLFSPTETKSNLASLTEYLEKNRPLNGYNSVTIDADPAVDNQTIVDFLTTAQGESIQNVAIGSCDSVT